MCFCQGSYSSKLRPGSPGGGSGLSGGGSHVTSAAAAAAVAAAASSLSGGLAARWVKKHHFLTRWAMNDNFLLLLYNRSNFGGGANRLSSRRSSQVCECFLKNFLNYFYSSNQFRWAPPAPAASPAPSPCFQRRNRVWAARGEGEQGRWPRPRP